MKSKILLFAATLLFVTSCSNKFSLVKRKYNKGFYVSVNKKSSTPLAAKHTPEKMTTTPEKVATQVVPAKSNNKIKTGPSATMQFNAAGNKPTKSNSTSKNSSLKVIAAASDAPVSFETKKSIKPVPAATKSAATDSEVNLILLVILAIILPPLGVYLKNKTIDKWFWITLIFTLLGYGVLFGGFGWGSAFALAAIVIALLYVFDVIK